MLIAVVPYFGWFFYLYTHTGVISGGIVKAHKKAKNVLSRYRDNDTELIAQMDSDGLDTGLIKYLSRAGEASVYKNTSVSYYSLGDFMFESISDELE